MKPRAQLEAMKKKAKHDTVREKFFALVKSSKKGITHKEACRLVKVSVVNSGRWTELKQRNYVVGVYDPKIKVTRYYAVSKKKKYNNDDFKSLYKTKSIEKTIGDMFGHSVNLIAINKITRKKIDAFNALNNILKDYISFKRMPNHEVIQSLIAIQNVLVK